MCSVLLLSPPGGGQATSDHHVRLRSKAVRSPHLPPCLAPCPHPLHIHLAPRAPCSSCETRHGSCYPRPSCGDSVGAWPTGTPSVVGLATRARSSTICMCKAASPGTCSLWGTRETGSLGLPWRWLLGCRMRTGCDLLAYALPTCVEPGRLRPAARCTLLQLVVALMSS